MRTLGPECFEIDDASQTLL